MILQSAREALKLVRAQTDSILVPYSAGKDSSVVLDLCSEIFDRVQPYYFYRVPNLEVAERMLKRAEYRYHARIIRLPAPDLSEVFRHALLQPHWAALDLIPKVTGPDMEEYIRRETGIDWTASGKRCSDSLPRRAMLRQCGGVNYSKRVVYPIWLWNRSDVLSYLRVQRIPTPPMFGRKEQGGIDFHIESFRYLKTHHPEDWKRWLEVFPYAEACILAADLRRDREQAGDQASS